MKPIYDFLLVAIGGSFGAMARYGIGLMMGSALGDKFPFGTLVANVVGCLLIGLLLGSGLGQANPKAKLLFGVGFLGSLTTFSTFGAETVQQATAGNWAGSATNFFANVVVGFAAVLLGIALGKLLNS